jgi:metallo-beta-lactamase class B
MKRHALSFFCTVLVLSTWVVSPANAQTSSRDAIKAPHINAAARLHLEKAWSAAYHPGHPLMVLYETVCAPALSPKGPVQPAPQIAPPMSQRVQNIPKRAEWYTEPRKVFDNLYWIGSAGDGYRVPSEAGDSIWAVTTSAGIILIDSANEYQAEELITNGLKKMGLNPADIKYLVLSHPHGDRYFGSRYVQDTYKARVIMSEADWATLAKSNEPNELKPRKDMVATDGMKLTLGDTTLTLYITPGHTPGTVSTLVPLKDGNQSHIGVVWGGINPSFERYGVRYYTSLQETFKIWSDAAARMQNIIKQNGADVYLTIHPMYDDAHAKIHAISYREPGDPHPMVSKENLVNFMTVIEECTRAQLARISS